MIFLLNGYLVPCFHSLTGTNDTDGMYCTVKKKGREREREKMVECPVRNVSVCTVRGIPSIFDLESEFISTFEIIKTLKLISIISISLIKRYYPFFY